MKKFLLVLLLVLGTSLPGNAGTIPMSIAGIRLGDSIAKYQDRCMTRSDVPLSDAMFLNELALDSDMFQGLRGGSIAYGNCASPGKIVWVKLKFEDRSVELFEELLRMYDNTLGDDRQWEGDAFHIITSWKWVLTEGDKEVNVLLTHSKDPEYRPGVSIKMTLRSHFNTEYRCWKKQSPQKENKRRRSNRPLHLEQYLPRR